MGYKKVNNMDEYLQKEFDELSQLQIKLEALSNSTILITGATGYIGSMLIKTFMSYNTKSNLNIHIIALIRSKKKAKDIFYDYYGSNNLEFIECDLIQNNISYDGNIDYIIHTASETKSKNMIEKPVDTIKIAIIGTMNVLDFAVEKNVRTFLYVSSMEMYGDLKDSENVTEDMAGYLNPLVIRNNYPESKRMCENMCIAYMKEYNVPVKIARLAQTFGVGILQSETRVFAQFAKSVIQKNNIVLHTDGKSEGNYVYIMDAIVALIDILLKGVVGEAYNVVNEDNHSTISAMAKMVVESFGDGKLEVEYDIPEQNRYGYPSEIHLKLSSEKLRKLGWKPNVDLKESYKRMIDYMKNNG
ncbi:NAD-dependent epimerase/dehydratase family protein [Butyrivibrio sp. JL13D10]|uniref:NAD-dependent epimerase/dehydratase family protein n=1 Tax=Butyrivibrio sp. JL13D10 TaxID=3236815 RepID=UPI0038B66658